MTYAFDGEVITEVANFKEESLVTTEGGEGQKGILKINLSMQGIEPLSPLQKKVKVLTSYTNWTLVCDGINCKKVSDEIKASISPPLQYPRLRRSILGIKAYLLYQYLTPTITLKVHLFTFSQNLEHCELKITKGKEEHDFIGNNSYLLIEGKNQ